MRRRIGGLSWRSGYGRAADLTRVVGVVCRSLIACKRKIPAQAELERGTRMFRLTLSVL
jgi:hypothetical protein